MGIANEVQCTRLVLVATKLLPTDNVGRDVDRNQYFYHEETKGTKKKKLNHEWTRIHTNKNVGPCAAIGRQ